MIYIEVFKEINLTKDKYKISNLLNQLLEIKPDENYIEDLKELTNKVREVKIDAIGLLSRYNNKELEDFFINKTESENDNFVVCRCIRGLHLNGSEKSAIFLLDLYKKTKSLDIKSEIIYALRIINTRNAISEQVKTQINKLIGNEYPFFHGYWTDLKKAEKTTKENWVQVAEKQLRQNNLNLLFVENEKYDLHIGIEKMTSDLLTSRHYPFSHIYCSFNLESLQHLSELEPGVDLCLLMSTLEQKIKLGLQTDYIKQTILHQICLIKT